MKRKLALLAWLVSAIFLAVSAGSNWKSTELTAEVGSALISVTGFDVYPISGALALLQLSALAVVLLVPRALGRFVQVVTAFSSVIMVAYAVSDWPNQTLRASVLAVSDAIGISGEMGQEEYIATSEVTIWPVMYLVALTINALLLLLGAILPERREATYASSDSNEDTDDLWESQKA